VKIIPPILRRAAISFCRDTLAPRAVARRADWPLFQEPVSVHMVLSRRTLLMGMLALRSLEFHSRMTWNLFIHEDGSLAVEDLKKLQAGFPAARIVGRGEADQALAEALSEFPACRENRLKHNWFLKFFDTRHFAPHNHYIVIDSDIVFFRRPDFILQWIASRSEDLWFMKDTREKYSMGRRDIEATLEMTVWPKVNSGLDLMYRPAVDLALAETFLEKCAPQSREYQFLEQSLFAITGSAWGKGGTLPAEYEISWNNFRRRDAVCRHYVATFKDDLLWIEGASSFWLGNSGTIRQIPR